MDGRNLRHPAKKLASRDPTDTCVEEAWQTVGGKGADF